MRVYSVKPDVEHYQWFQLEDRELSNSAVASPLPLDCTPRENGWISPKVAIPHPELKRGDFFDLDRTGQLILSPELRCRVAAERFFGDAGEILPLAYQGRQYLLLNVMQCINCLNLGKCQWSDEGYEGRRSLTRLVFHRDRFAYSSIFKVPGSAPPI